MKALGTGIGGFALTDVEVCRTPGKGATRNAPYLRLHGTAAEAGRRPGRGQLPPLADPHRRRGDRLRRGGTGSVRGVLTHAEMRAADAAALATVSHETLVDRAGTAAAHAALRLLGGAYGRRVVVVAGKGNNGADGRVAAAFLARRGARVRVVEAADVGGGDALPSCDLVIDARLRHRVPGLLRRAGAAGGRGGPGHRHPLGRRCRQRRRRPVRPCRPTAR